VLLGCHLQSRERTVEHLLPRKTQEVLAQPQRLAYDYLEHFAHTPVPPDGQVSGTSKQVPFKEERRTSIWLSR